VKVEYQIEIAAQKRQCKCDEDEGNYEKLMPGPCFAVRNQASAAQYEQETKSVFSQEIEAEELDRIIVVTKRQSKTK
jgi:hypothetical protein